MRLEAYLADPLKLEALIPGISALGVAAGNDRLRALRYGDDGQFGLTKLDADPEELRAALVAQRIRCWRALRPGEAFVRNVCREGQGKAACRFLGRDSTGPRCLKHTPLATYRNNRAEAGLLPAGDNCRGRSAV